MASKKLTTQEVADRLGITKRMVQRYRAEGRLVGELVDATPYKPYYVYDLKQVKALEDSRRPRGRPKQS